MKKKKIFGMLLCLTTLLSGCTNNVIDDFGYMHDMEAAFNSASTLIIGKWKMVGLNNKEIYDWELSITLDISADYKIVYDYSNGNTHQHKESDLILLHNWWPNGDYLIEGSIEFVMWGDPQDGNDVFKCYLNKNGKDMILVPNDRKNQYNIQDMYFKKME